MTQPDCSLLTTSAEKRKKKGGGEENPGGDNVCICPMYSAGKKKGKAEVARRDWSGVFPQFDRRIVALGWKGGKKNRKKEGDGLSVFLLSLVGLQQKKRGKKGGVGGLTSTRTCYFPSLRKGNRKGKGITSLTLLQTKKGRGGDPNPPTSQWSLWPIS